MWVLFMIRKNIESAVDSHFLLNKKETAITTTLVMTTQSMFITVLLFVAAKLKRYCTKRHPMAKPVSFNLAYGYKI